MKRAAIIAVTQEDGGLWLLVNICPGKGDYLKPICWAKFVGMSFRQMRKKPLRLNSCDSGAYL